MVYKRGRRNFETNKHAYRVFLTKFIENPSFEYVPIITALEYAHELSFKINRPLQVSAKKRLIDAILASQKKILKDLEVLKNFPETVIEPLVSDISLQRIESVTTQIVKDYSSKKRRSDEDLTNVICKKLKLSGSSENETVKCIINRWKEKYMQEKDNSILKYCNNDRKKIVPHLQKNNKIPVVVIESSKKLEDMARKFCNKKNNKNNSRDITFNEKEKHRENSVAEKDNGSENVNPNEINNGELQNENFLINAQENSSSNCVEHQKDHFTSHKNKNVNFGHLGYIHMKKECDLLEDSLQTSTSQLQKKTFEISSTCVRNRNNVSNSTNFYEMKSKFSQNVANTSTPRMPLHRQENQSTLSDACCNNLACSMHGLGNVNLLQNTDLKPSMGFGTCMAVPISQYNPNMINLCGLSGYHGMFNQIPFNPYLQYAMLSPQNHEMVSETQGCNNQISNPLHEIAKLQSALMNINTQISFLRNILITQSQSAPCFKKSDDKSGEKSSDFLTDILT